MALLKPFRGVRPPKELVQKLACPPYDVVSRAEARAYAQGNPQSFFHVSRPEIDLPDTVNEHADEVYARGKTNLKEFLDKGWLGQDPEPIYYLYRLRMGTHTQTGVVAGASVDEYDRGLVKKHELTRADKEDDRTRHVDALGGNDEPVFLTYRAEPKINELVEHVCEQKPEYDFITEDGIAHTLWLVRGENVAKLHRSFEEVSFLYIADGHHRSAAASRVQKLIRARRKATGAHDAFLSVVFPHDQLQILPYNRVVRDLNGLSEEEFLGRIGSAYVINHAIDKQPSTLHDVGMYLGKTWYKLTTRDSAVGTSASGKLDVAILQRNVLRPLLGIEDPRTDKRISFVGGIRGVGELERLVDSGDYKVAFALYPAQVEQMMAIADAGEIMPPKSTWFEPKLRSGLFLHLF